MSLLTGQMTLLIDTYTENDFAVVSKNLARYGFENNFVRSSK